MSAVTRDVAKNIWKARWLKRKQRELCAEYDVDPRRLFEVWEEQIHRGSRLEAWAEFVEEYPQLALRVDNSPHRKRLKVVEKPDEPDLFAA